MKTSDAVAYFKTKSNLAKQLGITHSSISQWGEEVPELRAFQLERLTGGELKVHADKAIESTSSPRVA
ncbi:Cro/Cl family transcriptional regulator [Shewanella sp. LC6]|jgi:DNA-binding transcriptional regulator YdaS (Cro superfamily)|uniref:Cro/CI family transcriptional regulator n=1 Tax=Shewanella TaxID=22 RepID=UPI0011270168|nr:MULTISPECIES: Cro/CI family transcriptional regulator [Shewanella]MBW0298526.1 Cro/Cl family transcriptional regulator [Shewanella xiamenensis]QQK59685.1 Cro/Cl family transcriptional regulator [Shewanella sp. LC6]TPE56652.1 Cro/Cl family transcriptional regulator [Shewanella sp. LC2]TVL22772.1 Cro/Cl family transcriptional regulator [Shewanella xiamenensis]TVL23077.1 Cro/Cl family transcriptional regulator [Shewanella xiamenensis]